MPQKVLTCGVRPGKKLGYVLLNKYPSLGSIAWDAREFYERRWKFDYRKNGLSDEVRRELTKDPGCKRLVEVIIAELRKFDRLIVYCDAGRHRSVVAMEEAVCEIVASRSCRRRIKVWHVDLEKHYLDDLEWKADEIYDWITRGFDNAP